MQEVSEELLETGAEEVANASEEAAAVETVEESDVSISEEK